MRTRAAKIAAVGAIVGMLVELARTRVWLAAVIATTLLLVFSVWRACRAVWRPVRIAVIGTHGAMEALGEEIRASRLVQYEVVGWIGDGINGADTQHLGSIGRLRSIVEDHDIGLLVLSAGAPRLAVFDELDRSLQGVPVHLLELAEFYEEHFHRIAVAEINSEWFKWVLHPDRRRLETSRSKRAFDLTVAAAMAVLLAPVLAALMFLVRRDGGPALYRQVRIGERGRAFQMLKLRTMRPHDGPGSPWCVPDDERITRVGRFARRTHLDELPQLINVLRGEMSIVGPRPEQPHYVAQLEAAIPFYTRRHQLRPGLTGWAQVHCGYGGSQAGSLWKLSHDLYYLKHGSLLLDVRILMRTLELSVRPPDFGEPELRPLVFGLQVVDEVPVEPVAVVTQPTG